MENVAERDMTHDVMTLYVWMMNEGGYRYVGMLQCEHGYALMLLAKNRGKLAVSQYMYAYKR